MLLVLRIQFYRNAPASLLPPAQFSEAGGTIGRSPSNDLVLDDPGKSISRTHARISFRDGRFYLADLGSNPSVVNDRPLGNGRELALSSGDRIGIGEYQLEAQVEAASADATLLSRDDPLGLGSPAQLPPTASRVPVQATPDLPLFEPPPPLTPALLPALDLLDAPQPDAGVTGTLPPSGLNDPFASARILDHAGSDSGFAGQHDPLGLNLFSAPVVSGAAGTGVAGDDRLGLAFRGSASDHAAPEHMALPATPAYVPAPVQAASFIAGGIPDDYDLMADLLSKSASAPPPACPNPAGFLPDIDFLSMPMPAATSVIEQVVEPVLPPTAPATEASAPALPIASTTAAIDTPGLNTLQDEIRLPDRPTTAAAPPSSVPQNHDATLEALLRGLGLPDLQTRQTGPELAELVGTMLREATSGTMQTLMARSLTKRESRIEMTMIASQANNPLKFFPDPASALNQMLSQTSGGYMKPVRAFGNAFEDLQAHELAVMAGMHAALATVLARFDPAAIEKRLAVPTVMDKMMASSRKAKMWDRLVALYADISREADDDFQRLFGESFAKAYEDQIDRLHSRGK